MTRRLQICLLATTLLATALTQEKREFPAHWGTPPEIQTHDYRPLPGGYGHGSSTLANWIETNLKKDQLATQTPTGPAKPLYECKFDALSDGAPPDAFMVLGGDFNVKHDGTNGFLELPGSPLDNFAVQFGPAEKENVAITAQILGTNQGRRTPTFGVGLGGVSGWKLQVSPGRKTIELLRDQDSRASKEFDWKGGTWMQLRLQVRKLQDGEWRIEGKTWPKGEPEPKDWQVSFEEKEAPIAGKASVFGSPFAGTPIQFDELRVDRVP
jgi:hypothetical protein